MYTALPSLGRMKRLFQTKTPAFVYICVRYTLNKKQYKIPGDFVSHLNQGRSQELSRREANFRVKRKFEY